MSFDLRAALLEVIALDDEVARLWKGESTYAGWLKAYFERDEKLRNLPLLALLEAVNKAEAVGPIPCNSPWERVPQHEADPGFGPVPPRPNVSVLFPEPMKHEGDAMTAPIRLCRDCKCTERGLMAFLHIEPHCKSPRNPTETDAVSGNIVPIYRLCSTIRASHRDDMCGPEARWFEPREG